LSGSGPQAVAVGAMPLLKTDELAAMVGYDCDSHVTGAVTITTTLLTPLWNRLVTIVPADVAPNALSLAGLICLVHAMYLCYYDTSGDGTEENSQVQAAVCAALIVCFWTLDALDSIHAQRIGSRTALTLIFDSICSTTGTVFLTLVVCASMSITDPLALWYAVQVAQLGLLNKHIMGAVKDVLSYLAFNGPGELLASLVALLLVRSWFGLSIFSWVYRVTLDVGHRFVEFDEPHYDEDPYGYILMALRTTYWLIMGMTVVRAATLPGRLHETRVRLLICLGYRAVPALLVWLLPRPGAMGLPQVLCDGLFMAVVTTDVLVSRMGKRQLHPWVVMMGMGSLVSSVTTIFCVLFYTVKLLHEISRYTRESVMSANINVYCDGVYDLLHRGHINAYKNALKHGTRLFVGVCSDEDVQAYKRAPVMTTEERIHAVETCKYVDKVIPNCPCTRGALDDAFIRKHNIHIVCAGLEYNKEGDLWYAAPRRKGILRYLPRTEGMSTSTLIRRIQQRYAEDGEDKPKDK
jgi:cytidyltransferase-like protein